MWLSWRACQRAARIAFPLMYDLRLPQACRPLSHKGQKNKQR